MRNRRSRWGVLRALHVLIPAILASTCGEPAGPDFSDRIESIESGSDRAFRTPTGRPQLVVLGDSLTAGLGVAPDESYPALLQERLDAAGYALEIVNAGVSGDTTAGGLRRVDWALQDNAVALIIALGGNDGLRGLPVAEMRDNLTAMIGRARDRGVEVVLAGMEAPSNFGTDYTDAFRHVFADLAHEHATDFVPFLLEGVAGVPELNQADGIHPNPAGAARIADHIWPVVEVVAKRVTREAPRAH